MFGLKAVLLTCGLPLLCHAMATSTDCAIVGCGVLGTSLCRQLLDAPNFASLQVTGITKTTSRHGAILNDVGGSSDRLSLKTAEECKGKKFQNVVFCAPPSGFDDYPGALSDCIENLWAGPTKGGAFVFTSSGAVYGSGKVKEVVNENSPTCDPEQNPRAARLIKAEECVVRNGGTCLRLAGLYTLDRGAHNYWMTTGKDAAGRSDGIINLLHYDDAAGAVVAALSVGGNVVHGNTYLISDGNPTTRRGICDSALKASKYKSMAIPKFTGSSEDPIGRIYDGATSNLALKWDPRYASFDSFMAVQG